MSSEHLRAYVEKQIQAAMSEGVFDNLTGKGKPIIFDDQTHVPPESRVAFQMLYIAGMSPAWLERQKDLRMEITRFRTDLRNTVTRSWEELKQQTYHRLRNECRRLNSTIQASNLEVPLLSLQLPGLIFELEVEVAELGLTKKKDQLKDWS